MYINTGHSHKSKRFSQLCMRILDFIFIFAQTHWLEAIRFSIVGFIDAGKFICPEG